MSDSSRPHGLQPTRLLRPWNFPGKSTGVGCHCLLCYQVQASLYQGLPAGPLRHGWTPTCSSPWAAVRRATRGGQSSKKASPCDSGGHKSRNQGAPSEGSGDGPLPASWFWQPRGSASPITRPLCLSSACLLYGHLSLDLGSMSII